MKVLITIFLLTFSSIVHANNERCVDLSFKAPLGAGSVEWQQVDCKKFHLTFLDPDGNPYSESETVFSEEFQTDSVDDEYEVFTNRQRWMWARDGKTLIHEATIDKFDKSTFAKWLNTFSELIFINDQGKIQREITQIIRSEDPEGHVTIDTKHEIKGYDRL